MKVGLIILNILRSKDGTEMLFSAEKACAEDEATLTENLLRLVTRCDLNIDVWISVFWLADRPGFLVTSMSRSDDAALEIKYYAAAAFMMPTQWQIPVGSNLHPMVRRNLRTEAFPNSLQIEPNQLALLLFLKPW